MPYGRCYPAPLDDDTGETGNGNNGGISPWDTQSDDGAGAASHPTAREPPFPTAVDSGLPLERNAPGAAERQRSGSPSLLESLS